MSTYVTVVGNMTEPKLTFTPSGTAVCSFSVADNHSKKDQSGKWVDEDPTWYRVTAWEQLGQNVSESLDKGSRVVVTGALRNRKWTDDEGNDRYSLEITAREVGPSLRWATAEVEKAERTDKVSKPADTASPFDPAEEPFS